MRINITHTYLQLMYSYVYTYVGITLSLERSKNFETFQREFFVHRCIIFTYLHAKQTFNMLNVTFPLAYSIEQLLGSLRTTVLRCSLPLPHSSPQKTSCHCALCLAGSLFHCILSVLHPVSICTSEEISVLSYSLFCDPVISSDSFQVWSHAGGLRFVNIWFSDNQSQICLQGYVIDSF